MAAPVKKNFSWFKFFNSCSIPEDTARSYAEIFVENHMKSDMLADLDKEVLQDLGIVSMGHIIRILKRAKALVEYQEKQRAKARREKEGKETDTQESEEDQQQDQHDHHHQQQQQQQQQPQPQQQAHYPYGPPQQLTQQQQQQELLQHQQPLVSPHQVAVAHIIGYDAQGFPVYAHQPSFQFQPQQMPQTDLQVQEQQQQHGLDQVENAQDIPASRVKVTRTGVQGGSGVVAKRQHDDDAERTTRVKDENGGAAGEAKQTAKRHQHGRKQQQQKQEDSDKKKSVFDRIRGDDKRRVKKGRGSTGAKMDEVDSQRSRPVVHPKKKAAQNKFAPPKKAVAPTKPPPKAKSIFNRLSK